MARPRAAGVAAERNPPRTEPYEPLRTILAQLEDDLPADRTTYVYATSTGPGFALGYELEIGIVHWLRRTGRDVVVSRAVADRLSPEYATGSYQQALRVNVGRSRPGAGRVVTRLTVRDPIVESNADRVVTVSTRPVTGVR